MNAKQAAKAASKRIEELEDWNAKASAEIKHLNQCIDSVIAGEKTYCDWCEDQEECQRECKGKGCSEWWLMINIPADDPEEGSAEDESKGFLLTGAQGGEGT